MVVYSGKISVKNSSSAAAAAKKLNTLYPAQATTRKICAWKKCAKMPYWEQ